MTTLCPSKFPNREAGQGWVGFGCSPFMGPGTRWLQPDQKGQNSIQIHLWLSVREGFVTS